MYVLRPLTKIEFDELFSPKAIKIIQYFLNTAIFSQPEVKENQKLLPLQIPKEHLEQWFLQALNVEADVKMLFCKVDKLGKLTNGDSGETLFAYKFRCDI